MLYELMELIELIIPVLISIAFITLAESKMLASMQSSQGPMKMGKKGLLQSMADGMKLVMKESMMPLESNSMLFLMAPMMALSMTLMLWLLMPLKKNMLMFDDNLNLLLFYVFTSISIYSVLYSGWASNSKYGFMGSMSSMSQLLSYEMSMGLMLMNMMCMNNSFNFSKMMENQMFISNIYMLLPMSIFFFISMLAETLSSPFDMVECESEMMAGNLMEYAGMMFAGMYLAEYSNMMLLSSLCSILFFGNSLISLTTFFFIFCFIWVRGSLPSLSWDQLLYLGWTKMLPFSIGYLLFLFSLFM